MHSIALFLIGLVVLIIGAEMVVRAAAQVAVMLRVSPMFIGLTIVSIGTSAPELAVGVIAGRQGNGGLAVGNIAGTNVLNLLLILGLSALLRPLPLRLQVFKLELPVVVLAAVLMNFLALDGVLSAIDGYIMLAAGVAYTTILILVTRNASRLAKEEFSAEYGPQTVPKLRSPWMARILAGVILVVGIGLTVFGADLSVRGAVELATSLGVSPALIGLTIVAMGTSAPELVTTLVSTFKEDRDVAVGNLLGSSIYNILFILSVPCIVSPGGIPVEPQLLWFDIPFMTIVALGLVPIFLTGKQITRFEGGLGVAIYFGYLAWLIVART